MLRSRLIPFCTCLATLSLLTSCSGNSGGSSGGAQAGGNAAGGATTSSGGSSLIGGASAGGSKATGGTSTAAGGSTSAGGAPSAGGATSGGGAKTTGGTTSGGGTSSAGGAASAGGTSSAGGTTSGGGGTPSAGGTTSAGGALSAGGTTTATTDCLGQTLAKVGDSTSTSKKYLNLGDIRLLDNRWGSDALGCSGTQMKVSVNSDKTFGYDFNRPTCGGSKGKPDYPEIEFGVAPFGANSSDLTSPACSSTSLLPIQLKSLTSATLNIDNFVSTFSKPGYYDTNFEFWISRENPLTSSSPGVYAEIIAFLGWDGVRMASGGWPCDKSGSVTAGGVGFNLCHQKDGWGSGWRFFNFNVNNGPVSTFSGKVDIKALLDWVMKTYSGFTTDMWLTRIEVGTEVDDNTAGTAKFNNLTFEINGTSKSVELAQ